MARRKGIVHTRVVEVIEPSPHRVTPPCPEVANGCGACQWQHIDLDAQRRSSASRSPKALGLAGEADGSRLRPTVALPATGFRTTVHAAVTHGRAGISPLPVPPRRPGRRVPRRPSAPRRAHRRAGATADASEVLLRCGASTGERLAMPTPRGTAIDVPADVRSDHVHEVAAGQEWQRLGPFVLPVAARRSRRARGRGHRGRRPGSTRPDAALDLYSGVGVFAGVLAAAGLVGHRGRERPQRSGRRPRQPADARCLIGARRRHPLEARRERPGRGGPEPGRPGPAGCRRRRGEPRPPRDPHQLRRREPRARRHAAAPGRLPLSYATPVDLFPHTFHIEVVSVYDR